MNKPIELEGLETQGEAQKALDFPYSFAKRNGVVLQRGINGELTVHYKKGISPAIANEVNRFLQTKVSFKLIENELFYLILKRRWCLLMALK